MPVELMPYQDQGARFIASRERSGLLDEPGAGKTCQTIRAIDLRRARRGLVICPAHLRENWRGEFLKFSHFQRRTSKGRTMHDFVAWTRGVFDIMMLSYEKARLWAPLIHDHAELLDFVALDEAHYLNNPETSRSQLILGPEGTGHGGIIQYAEQTFWLTGTPMPNDPANCYSFLRFVKAIDWPFPKFQRHFFKTRNTTWSSRNTPREEHLPDLQRLIGNNSMWRTLESVGYQLPPIFVTSVLVDGNTDALRAKLKETPGLDEAIIRAVEVGGLKFLESQHIATIRRLLAEAKAVPYAEMLIEELKASPGRKYVVMGGSREPLAYIRDQLTKHGFWSVLVQGGVADRVREQGVRDFQENPDCRIFLGNMISAGTGNTLTAAQHVDVFEASWNPSLNDQAIKRVRRISQKYAQYARFITLAGTFDVEVTRSLVEKTSNIKLVEGDRMIAQPEVVA